MLEDQDPTGVVKQLFADHGKNATTDKISAETWEKIKVLASEHILDRPAKEGDFFLDLHMGGTYGHLEVTKLMESFEFSPRGPQLGFLWTDHSTTEPFNRQSIFYNGMRFSNMTLVSDASHVREFRYKTTGNTQLSQGDYNSYHGTVRIARTFAAENFGILISGLMELLGKPDLTLEWD